MREEVIFRMESAYREDFEVKSYHFGGPEKTMCIIGNMRGNEIQQLYIAGQMVRTLKRFEEEGRCDGHPMRKSVFCQRWQTLLGDGQLRYQSNVPWL